MGVGGLSSVVGCHCQPTRQLYRDTTLSGRLSGRFSRSTHTGGVAVGSPRPCRAAAGASSGSAERRPARPDGPATLGRKSAGRSDRGAQQTGHAPRGGEERSGSSQHAAPRQPLTATRPAMNGPSGPVQTVGPSRQARCAPGRQVPGRAVRPPVAPRCAPFSHAAPSGSPAGGRAFGGGAPLGEATGDACVGEENAGGGLLEPGRKLLAAPAIHRWPLGRRSCTGRRRCR